MTGVGVWHRGFQTEARKGSFLSSFTIQPAIYCDGHFISLLSLSCAGAFPDRASISTSQQEKTLPMKKSATAQTQRQPLESIQMLTLRQVADTLSVSIATVFRLIKCQSPPARSQRLASGLHRNESRTWRGALLWLRCPRHQGTLTGCPSWPSMPSKEREI